MFGMQDAKKKLYLVWHDERAYICTKIGKSVFGYLVWVCLKCTVQHNVFCRCSTPTPHTSELHMSTKVSQDTQCRFMECVTPATVCLQCGTPNAHSCAPKIPTKGFLDTQHGCLKCTMPQKVYFQCGLLKTHTSTPKYINKSCFAFLAWVCVQGAMPKHVFPRCGAPNVPTSARKMAKQVFLGTQCVCIGNA